MTETMKVKTSNVYSFERESDTPEAYTAHAHPDSDESFKVATITRREGTNTWDVTPVNSDEVQTVEGITGILEAETAEEMQDKFRATFKVLKATSLDEVRHEYASTVAGSLAAQMKFAAKYDAEPHVISRVIEVMSGFFARLPEDKDEAVIKHFTASLAENIKSTRKRQTIMDMIKRGVSEAIKEMEGGKESPNGGDSATTAPHH